MKQVLITGANRGLGLAHVRHFASRGINVIAAVRHPEQAKDLEALHSKMPDKIKIIAYDATNLQASATLKQAVGETPIDLLFANAGAFGAEEEFGHIDIHQFLNQIQINALAPLQLAEAFVQNVAQSNRKLMVFQSSIMGSVSLNETGGAYAYRASKATLNMIVKNLSIELQPRQITVVALHPGWVNTRMGGLDAPVDVIDSVEKQQAIFRQLTIEKSGSFINYDGLNLDW